MCWNSRLSLAVALAMVQSQALAQQAGAQQAGFTDAVAQAGKVADLCDVRLGVEMVACYKAVLDVIRERIDKSGKPGPLGASVAVAPPSDTAEPPPPVSSSPIVPPSHSAASSGLPISGPVRLSSADLLVQTHKWDGKIVQTALRCFYADSDEYRCLTNAGTRIDFSLILPDAARERIETKCDRTERIMSKSCAFQMQFVYDHFDEMETGGLGRRSVVIPRHGLGFVVEK